MALVPVRWYAGTFTLAGRVLRLPVARGCAPLVVRLDRDPPYPAGQVRSVTLLCEAGRLHVDVTAEVPVAAYPDGEGPDPGRVAGVDLGIIHPYAAAGPDGQLLLVSGRAIRAECRQHLREAKARARAVPPGGRPGRGSGGRGGGGSSGAASGRPRPGTGAGCGRPSTRPPRPSSAGPCSTGSGYWRSATRAACLA